MRYNPLGNTGVLVSELCFGAMTFGGKGFWEAIGRQTQSEANELLKTSYDGGITFIDTANVYSYGLSEKILGEGIRQTGIPRHDLFIATKVHGRMSDKPNEVGLSRLHVYRSVDESLQRLGVDHIDLLYAHGFDVLSSTEEIVHTFHDIVMGGKVRYVGVCNWPAWQVMKAIGIAKVNRWHHFVAMQYYYAAANRDSEHEIIPMAMDQNIGFMPWSPLAGGFLSGKFTRESQNTGGGSRRDSFDFPALDKEKAFDMIDIMAKIAKTYNVSVAEIALAWVRQQKGVTSTIIGTRTLEQLKANLHSTTFNLSNAELKEINDTSGFHLLYPGWMVERSISGRFPSESA